MPHSPVSVRTAPSKSEYRAELEVLLMQGTLDLMRRRAISANVITEFAAINFELLELIARHEIAARNRAVIPVLVLHRPWLKRRSKKNK